MEITLKTSTKRISWVPLFIGNPLASFVPSGSGRADFSIIAGRLAGKMRSFDEVMARAAIKRGI